jgi:hypothetical protein
MLVNFHKILLKFTRIRIDFQLTKFFGEFYMIFFLSVEFSYTEQRKLSAKKRSTTYYNNYNV